jgi:CRP/FNR family transcriptional regulator, anaerobic regulatory protein
LGGSCLADRLAHHVRLSDQEQAALEALEDQERAHKRGAVIVGEHDSQRELYVVRKGWLHSAVLLGNGSRQIMRFHFPGDIIGLSCLAFGASAETVTAVTDGALCPFDRNRLGDLFRDQPRLAALLFALAAADRVAIADRLASVARTSARARVGSLICEMVARLRLIEGEGDGEFAIPLTQEDIGDATGLTSVHVNRMLRGLVEDGMIERSGNRIRLLDERRLASDAGFADRSRIDTSWLPPSA